MLGQFVFGSAKTKDTDLKVISNLAKEATGIFVIEPDAYGVVGKVVAKNATQSDLIKFVAKYTPPAKIHGDHVQFGVQMGLRWKTEIPVTDQQSLKAAKRTWKD